MLVRPALVLYRRILRVHRSRLPDSMRQLGDSYVREEFKKHKKADAKFLGPFFREWTAYVEQLEKQSVAAGPIGSSLDSALASSLSEEQQAQLSKLREEAEKASWH